MENRSTAAERQVARRNGSYTQANGMVRRRNAHSGTHPQEASRLVPGGGSCLFEGPKGDDKI